MGLQLGWDGHPWPPTPCPIGRHGSGLGLWELRHSGRPARVAPHYPWAWRHGDSLPTQSPACSSSDSQMAVLELWQDWDSPVDGHRLSGAMPKSQQDGFFPWQLPLELRKPRELYKSSRQMEPDRRRQPSRTSAKQIRMAWQPVTAIPKP